MKKIGIASDDTVMYKEKIFCHFDMVTPIYGIHGLFYHWWG